MPDANISEIPFARLLGEYLDPDWYLARHPDIDGSNLDPYQHFTRYGAVEKRDPNRFFDNVWYIEHYPDVAASGLIPLLHYAQAGAAELRNPHPKFDARYYVEQHPDAAVNPLLYHLRVGAARGYLTEKPIDIRDYLPSNASALPLPRLVFADVVIPVQSGLQSAKRCIDSVLANRALPLARIIVVDDHLREPELVAWLGELAAEGKIHLIRNRRRLGFAASAAVGIDAAEGHDVVLLRTDTQAPFGRLRRLMAHAYVQPDIATVSPLSDTAAIGGYRDVLDDMPERIDEACQTVNTGRSVNVPVMADHCVYIRRAALLATGGFNAKDFCKDAIIAGWRHRLACDVFLAQSQHICPTQVPHAVLTDVLPFQFAVTATLFQTSKLPVILMVTHNFGGGIRRHIDNLIERYRNAARVLVLQGTNRGAALLVPSLPDHPLLTLSADRIDDLITVLRSAGVSRIHIHHLLQMDMDIRVLVHRLGVPFDVTVHDYYAICPQINLLRWEEGLYCGEPGPAACNACIAGQSSHGARDIVSWRQDWAWQFMDADRVICPSKDVEARLDRHGMGGRAFVVPHEQQTDSLWTMRLPAFTAPPLRIVLLGVLANHKGARAVAEVAETVAPGMIELHLIGHLEARFPKPARRLIKATGPYEDRDLPLLLQRIDPHVFWFPSSAPETYSYTLSTAIATGLPIVATDLGSFTERLIGRPLSWLVDHRASSKEWLETFDAVRAVLCDRADQRPVSRTVAVSNFYADRYLSPTAVPRVTVHRAADLKTKTAATQSSQRPRIAIVPERYGTGGLTPCAYIRLLQPLDHPMISDRFDVILTDTETVFNYNVDVIVTQRHALPDVTTANRVAEHARRSGAKLLYDLDDDLLTIPSSHPDVATLRPFGKTVRRMLGLADAVWVSTAGLAERLASIRADPVVIENALDERIWIYNSARDQAWDDPIRILCMGTSTHDHDFAMIEPALVRLKEEYGDRIVIDVLGMTSRSELPTGLNRIGPSTHASRSYPGFVDWLTSMQPRWHIGLAPLLDTPFNRSKSAVKAMDYAALGLTVLASDGPVYRGSIADGPAGQLVTNTHQAWHAALDWLIRSQAFRTSSGMRARDAFLVQATLASQAKKRLAAWTQLLADRSVDRGTRLRDASAALTIAHGATDPVTRKRRHSGRGR